MSMPISETMTCAPRFLIPGIDMINSTAVRKGPRLASTWASIVANGGFESVDLIEMKAQQEAMVLGHATAKGLAELLR